MKSFAHRRRSLAARIATLVVAAVGLTVVASGCSGGSEGDRCVPTSLRSSDECGNGLSCQQIGACGESYCCPMDLSKAQSVYCNASSAAFSSCPAPDAGDDGGDATDAPANDALGDSPVDAPNETSDGGPG